MASNFSFPQRDEKPLKNKYSSIATTESNELLVLRVIDFAARKHRDQRRKDQEASPYINHPISVSLVLAEIGGITDAEILSAAILHDTLDDTDTTPEEIAAAFGGRVRTLVEEVSDDKRLPKAKRKELQIAYSIPAQMKLLRDHATDKGIRVIEKFVNSNPSYPPKWLHIKMRTLAISTAALGFSN